MVKKNKAERRHKFKADMQTIKKEDVRKLQETFRQFLGSEPNGIKKHSAKLRNKIYFFGFVATVFLGVMMYLTKNIKFVGM